MLTVKLLKLIKRSGFNGFKICELMGKNGTNVFGKNAPEQEMP